MRDEDPRAGRAGTFEQVLSGAAEADVYARWRDRHRERSRRRGDDSRRRSSDPPTTIDVPAAVATSRAGEPAVRAARQPSTGTTVTDVVLAFDQNITFPAAVLVESMLANASGPLRLWVLGRGLPDDLPGLAGGGVPVAPDHVPAVRPDHLRARRPPAPHPEADHDLDDGPAAPAADARRRGPGRLPRRRHGDARRRVPRSPGPTSAAGRSPRATRTSARPASGDGPDATSRSRRPPTCGDGFGRRSGYGAAALNAGVLVMDLDRMRRDDFTATLRSAGSSTTGSTTRTACSPTSGRSGPCSIRAGTRCPSSRTSTTRASSTGPASASPGSPP